jgi:hypothetical protein
MKLRTFKLTVIAAAVGASTLAGAAETQESIWDSVGITLGGGAEYESKRIGDYLQAGGATTYNRQNTAQLAQLTLNLPQNSIVQYTLSQTNAYETYSSSSNKLDTDGYKNVLYAGRTFPLGSGGLTGGLYYTGTFIAGTEKAYAYGTDYSSDQKSTDNRIKTSLNYASPDGKFGTYAYGELFQTDLDNNVWWSTSKYKTSTPGSAFMVQPSIKMGPWTLQASAYYSSSLTRTDLGSARVGENNFKEQYLEPKLTYNVEDGGSLWASVRSTDQETLMTGGSWYAEGSRHRYFANVKKVAVGYQQDVGNWNVSAQVRRSWQTDQTSAYDGDKKETVDDLVNVYATYKF